MRRWPSCVGIVAVLLSYPAVAAAGTFEVASCGATPTKRSAAWATSIRSGEPIESADWCVSGQAGTDGDVDFSGARFLRPPIPPPGPLSYATPGKVAGLTFSAPASGTLSSVTYRRRLRSIEQSWQIRLMAGVTKLEDCVLQVSEFECADTALNQTFSTPLPANTTSLALEVWCVDSVCPYNPGPLYDFAAVIYSSVVTVQESIPPTVAAPLLTGLTNGWVGAGAPVATLSGSDTLGLRRIELLDGSDVVQNVANSGCVDWSVLPCSDSSVPGLGPGFNGSASLAGLSDGVHQLKTRATDAAGNQALSAAVEVKVDHRVPVPYWLSRGGTVGGESVAVNWLKPDGPVGSPITASRAKVCTGAPEPTTCRWEAAPIEGPLSIALGPDGTRTEVQIEMTDEAGNVGLSSVVEYLRDSTAPAAPQLALVAGSGAKRSIDVTATDPDVAEYALRICGPAGCIDSRRPATGRVDVDLGTPASYRVEVGLVDRVGNVGATSAVSVDYADTKPGDSKPTGLKLQSPTKLRPRITKVDIVGTVRAGSASKVTVTVKGRPAGRKKNVTYKATAKPTKSGKWTVRLKLPRGVSRRHGVLVKVTATPNAGYLGATVTRRIRG